MTYDGAGNVLTVNDGDSRLTFVYDEVHRVVEARTGATSSQPASTLTYAYDANGNRVTLTDSAGGTVRYDYDARDNLTSRLDPKGQTITFAYDALDRRDPRGIPTRRAGASPRTAPATFRATRPVRRPPGPEDA